MTEDRVSEVAPQGRWKIAIVVFPLLLFVSIAGSIWYYWSSGRVEEVDPRLAMQAGPRDGREFAEHLEKLTAYIGPRHWGSEGGRQGLRQTIAYIDGTLSPQNYGFKVERENAISLDGELWPVLWVEVGSAKADQGIVVEVAYDGEPGDVAVALAALDRIRGASGLERGLRFLFVPRHAPAGARPLHPERVGRGPGAAVVSLEYMLGQDLSFRIDGKEAAKGDVPNPGEMLVIAGEGGLMDERVQVERPRWLAGFLRSVARGR